MKNRYILFLLFIATSIASQAQNVGVGIAAPNDLFHVSGTAAQGILFNNATTGTAVTNGFRMTIDASKNVVLTQQEAAEMQFWTATGLGIPSMRIDATGHVAINGPTGAAYQLVIIGANSGAAVASVNSTANAAGLIGAGNAGTTILPGATSIGVMGSVGPGNSNVGVGGYLGAAVDVPNTQGAGVFGSTNAVATGVGIYGLAQGATTNTAGYFSASGGATANYGIKVGAGDVLISNLAGGASVNVAGTNPYSLMTADATGLVGKIITSFPPAGNSLELWMRPTGAFYIQPVSNANIQVYDNNAGTPQPYGIYYNGSSNAIGGYFVTSGIPSGYTKTIAVEGYSNVPNANAIGYLGYDGPYTFGSPIQTLQGFAVYGEVTQASRASGFFQTTGAATVAANINYSNVWIPNYDYVDNSSTLNFPPGVYSQVNQTGAMPGVLGVPYGAVAGYYNYTGGGNLGYSVSLSGADISQTQDALAVEGITFSNAGNSAGGQNAGGLFQSQNFAGSTVYGYAFVGARLSNANWKINGVGTTGEIIPTPTHGRIEMECPESPEYWYQDYGSVQLVNGKSHVDLDPVLADVIVVDKDNPLKVFCTPVDMPDFNGVTIMNRTAKGFDIVELNQGRHNGEIDYQIVAKPKTNYGQGRFAQAPGPAGSPKNLPAAKTANQNTTIWNWPSDPEVYHYTLSKPKPQTANAPNCKPLNGIGISLPQGNTPH